MTQRWNRFAVHGATAAASAILAVSLATASLAHAQVEQKLQLGVGLDSYHTDNLLQYSTDQIAQFNSGTAPTHFSIKSIDDFVWRPSVSFAWATNSPHGRGREIRLRGSGEFHQTNATVDFHSVSVSWREMFSRQRRLTASAFYIPSYYLRQLFDNDVTGTGVSHYRRAEFSLFMGSAGWKQKLARRLLGEIGYRYERRGYNPDFKERTSNTHQGLGSIEWYRPGSASLALHAGYRKSIARADDGDPTANDDADVSYHGPLGGLSGSVMILGRKRPQLEADAAYEYSMRNYDAERPTDSSHYGRNDRHQAIEVGLGADPGFRLHFRAFYRFEWNRADFPPTGGPTTDPSSFDENQAGIALDWSTLLWQSNLRKN